MLPTLFLIGIIFAPIGALIIWGSGKVTDISLDYTQCDELAPTNGSFKAMPDSAWDCEYESGESGESICAARSWAGTGWDEMTKKCGIGRSGSGLLILAFRLILNLVQD